MREALRRALPAALAVAALTGCTGEPAVDVEIPARADGQQVADLAGILDGPGGLALLDRLNLLGGTGLDVVVLTYETEQASCGEAFRAGGEFVQAWDADVAVVAVARPGDFTSTDETSRERCLGVRPADERALSEVREEIAEEIVPPIAATNDWPAAFVAAVDRIAEAAAPGVVPTEAATASGA